MRRVLDQIGSVELLDSMPAFNPSPDLREIGVWDQAVVQAARVTHLEGTKGYDKDAHLIERLMRDAHTSPFEQVQIKFRINAPMIVWWQWVRHRTFSFQSINSQSGRYSAFDEEAVYIPHIWRLQSKSNHQGSAGELDDDTKSDEFTEILESHYEDCFKLYQRLLGEGISKEMARLALPGFALYYMWIVSVNLHNLMAFFKLRLADDVQEEMYLYALQMFREVFPQAPVTLSLWMKFHTGIVYDKDVYGEWKVAHFDVSGVGRNYNRFFGGLAGTSWRHE